MRHIDLFSGIGGFALAAKTVWGSEYETIAFCDNNEFCQKVLTKNFPGVPIYGDIRTLTNAPGDRRARKWQANAPKERLSKRPEPSGELARRPQGSHSISGIATNSQGKRLRKAGESSKGQAQRITGGCDLLTGGFPCQPFSNAGKRRGTEDDRYLWPEMLRVIREFKPRWVIGENVAGLVTWSDGLVLEQVCTDLEKEGYEVQPFIIPAVSVNAPHRRDRVWIIANREGVGHRGSASKECGMEREKLESNKQKWSSSWGKGKGCYSWDQDWTVLAARLCRVDDGLSKRMVKFPDSSKISKAKWRQEALRAYGNAIVPQVAIKIMEAIRIAEAKNV